MIRFYVFMEVCLHPSPLWIKLDFSFVIDSRSHLLTDSRRFHTMVQCVIFCGVIRKTVQDGRDGMNLLVELDVSLEWIVF